MVGGFQRQNRLAPVILEPRPATLLRMPAPTTFADDFTAAFARNGRALWLVAASWVGREEASDLVQESARIAWQKRATFTAGTDLTGWLAQIVRHVGANWRRKRRPEVGNELGEPLARDERVPAATFDADGLGLSDEVAAALASLTQPQRAALLLHVVGDLGFAEIGRLLDVPENTATSHARRARVALRVALTAAHALRRIP